MLAEVAIVKHSPDMAAGASYMVGLGGEPIYCQEIESSQPQRKSVDPPSSDELRRKHRGGRSTSSRTRYNLEPLEENSCEGTKSRASTKCSLEPNPNRKVRNRYSDADTEYPLPKKKQVGESAKKKKQQQLDPPYNRKDRLSERRKKQGGATNKDPPPSYKSKEPRGRRSAASSGHNVTTRSKSATKNTQGEINNNRRKRRARSLSKPKPKSILKKKDSNKPPPITYFGGLSVCSDNNNNDDTESSLDSSEDDSPEPQPVISDDSGNETEDGSDVMSLSMASTKSASTASAMSSAIRRGRFTAAANDNMTDANSSSSSSSSGTNSSASFSISTGSGSYSSSGFKFDRSRSHYMRTSDLGLTQDTIFAEQFLDNPSEKAEPHYHCPTPSPPPGIQFNIDEDWICIDDGNGNHSPIAPQAVDALVEVGYRRASDTSLFTPTKCSRKYMTEKRLTFDSIPLPGPRHEGAGSFDDICLLWTGKLHHRYFGSELPVIRSQGIVNVSAEQIVDLLMDSQRVGEYNKSSIGRSDEVVLSYGDELDNPFSGTKKKKLSGVVVNGATIIDGCAFIEKPDEEYDGYDSSSSSNRKKKISKYVGVTKLVRSANKLPLVRKSLEFTTILHCRELTEDQGGNGYILVSRSITPAEDEDRKGFIRSEVLSSVTIIRRLHQSEKGSATKRTVPISETSRVAPRNDLRNRCLVTTMNHTKSPFIPKLMAKQIGLNAAKNFLLDIRMVKSHR